MGGFCYGLLMRKTISLDLRQRILDAYDRKEGDREEVARRFCVSLGMVKKLLQQRRRTGDLRPRHCFSGPRPKLVQSHQQQLRQILARKPDLTLEQMRRALTVRCTLQAVHYLLERMGLTYKKRHSGPANKTALTSARPAAGGSGNKRHSIRPA
jgi:transposase